MARSSSRNVSADIAAPADNRLNPYAREGSRTFLAGVRSPPRGAPPPPAGRIRRPGWDPQPGLSLPFGCGSGGGVPRGGGGPSAPPRPRLPRRVRDEPVRYRAGVLPRFGRPGHPRADQHHPREGGDEGRPVLLLSARARIAMPV